MAGRPVAQAMRQFQRVDAQPMRAPSSGQRGHQGAPLVGRCRLPSFNCTRERARKAKRHRRASRSLAHCCAMLTSYLQQPTWGQVGRLRVHCCSERSARRELRHLLRRDLDRGAGLRIEAGAGRTRDTPHANSGSWHGKNELPSDLIDSLSRMDGMNNPPCARTSPREDMYSRTCCLPTSRPAWHGAALQLQCRSAWFETDLQPTTRKARALTAMRHSLGGGGLEGAEDHARH